MLPDTPKQDIYQWVQWLLLGRVWSGIDDGPHVTGC